MKKLYTLLLFTFVSLTITSQNIRLNDELLMQQTSNYDWIDLHTTNETSFTFNLLTSKSNLPFEIDLGDGNRAIINSGDSFTHTYSTPYTGNVCIRVIGGNIYEELHKIAINSGHWDFDLSVFSPCVDIDSFWVQGEQIAITGDLSDLSNVTRWLALYGDLMTIKGDLSDVNVYYYLYLFGNSMDITGDLSYMSSLSNYLFLSGNGFNITYTTTTWSSIPSNTIYLRLGTGRLTQPEIDQLLIDLNASGISGTTTIDLQGNNAAPSAAADIAIRELTEKGHTVLTN